MSSNSPTSKKRKAEEISDECVVNVPHLPAPVWGSILDFMPYSEVRSALLVGKHIAVEAVKYVKTINVMNSRELNIAAARRFPNVDVLKILCLLEGTGEFNENGDEQFTVSLETAHCTPSFLSAFPRLKEAFVGGRLAFDYGGPTFDNSYSPEECIGPEDHEEIIRGLVFTTAGAFKSGLLSQSLMIDGVDSCTWALAKKCRRVAKKSCLHCWTLCRHFPFSQILREGFDPSDYCFTESDFWSILGERPGGKQAVEDATEERLCKFIEESLFSLVDSTVELKAKPIIEIHCRELGDTVIWHLSKDSFRELDKVIGAGLDPRRIRKKYFLDEFKFFIDVSSGLNTEFNIWTKSTVIGLESRGFPVSCDDIITVDDL